MGMTSVVYFVDLLNKHISDIWWNAFLVNMR